MQAVLLPSPLLGPAVWQPVAEVLERRGWATTIASGMPAISSADDVLDAYDGVVADVVSPVLVAHSNAGLYVPWLASRHRLAGAVFVDAGLPPTPGSVSLAPPELYDFLTDLADDAGVLPPWPEWWPAHDLEALVPDPGLRARVCAEAQRLPLSYFAASVPVPAGWDAMRCAYLAFGDTYARERADALGRGWPVRTIPGRHLHMAVDPESVADAIDDLSSP